MSLKRIFIEPGLNSPLCLFHFPMPIVYFNRTVSFHTWFCPNCFTYLMFGTENHLLKFSNTEKHQGRIFTQMATVCSAFIDVFPSLLAWSR